MKRIIQKSACLLFCLLMIFSVFSASTVSAEEKPTLKILCIGHSYAWDSMEYLYKIAKSQGVELTVGLAYRGNCSVKEHLDYLNANVVYGESGNKGFYLKYDKNNPDGKESEKKIKDIIKDEEWDILVFQESLNYAGLYDTITSQYLTALVSGVKKLCKNKSPEIWWNQIWALENPKAIPLAESASFFEAYDNDQNTMYEMVKESANKAAKDIGGKVIPTGDAFQLARAEKEFDTLNGGETLMRDNVANHSNNYGKYLAALVWYQTLTGCKLDKDALQYPELTKTDLVDILVDCSTEAVRGKGYSLEPVEEAFAERAERSKSVSSEETTESKSESTEEKANIPILYIIGGAVLLAAIIAAAVIFIIKKK